MIRFILATLLCFFCFGNVFPQAEGTTDSIAEIKYDRTEDLKLITFNKAEIETYKSQEEFDYLDRIENDSWWTRFKRYINLKYEQFTNWLFGEYTPGGFLQFIITIFPYLILVLVLGFVFWLITRLDPGSSLLNSPAEPEVFLSEEEEIIQSKDISRLIDEAIANKQYRLAVRYYYLLNLKRLDETGIISYQLQKTNEDYSGEIQKESVKQQFRKITRLYDFIWYGDFKVSETDFRLAEKGFLQMNSVLENSANE
ncbi:DUF4129 domain-containing protein [Salegentibacter sp. F188]|uniref:DUF4129 domain-containing protein n=1 Tax=Autumnicola patrickiae TaxID=3075591 RepID=A0ABU3DZG2_9FLAO|nr:DUF4129 domain-containing protein [Salegentibacter sp. F188]MDT0689050.1 DUF4129 domain-containing protein [Salegentibacter sp. F188]